jgi:hypothetical protein
MEWLIGLGLWGLLVLFAWALCAAGGRADDEMERIYEDAQNRR